VRRARSLGFELLGRDGTARRTRFATAHGRVECPAFMPVGTVGAVKAVLPRDVADTGADVILANTYHMSLQDRTDLVERAGGLHSFMAWERTILTDSGGFQVFSLPGRQVSEDGVTFPGDKGKPNLFLDPEGSMDIQRRLGADIVMAFDECCEHDAPRDYVTRSVDRTARWARRCRDYSLGKHQFLFGIVQGGVHRELRERSAAQIRELDFDGYAIGGVSVGEGHELMCKVTEWAAPLLPEDRPSSAAWTCSTASSPRATPGGARCSRARGPSASATSATATRTSPSTASASATPAPTTAAWCCDTCTTPTSRSSRPWPACTTWPSTAT
jgi:queuine tRNA-ribosyltransferase